MELGNWGHDHPWVLSEEKADDFFSCSVCFEHIVGLCYCCVDCKYALHKWCAELPRELTDHPLHPDHPLARIPTLVVPMDPTGPDDTRGPMCGACESEIYIGSGYSCDRCPFALHAKCAVLPKQLEFEFLGPDSLPIRKSLTLSQKITNWGDCFICKERVGYLYFVSENVKDMAHVQCAMLPRTVKHEHHLHDLVLSVPIEKDLLYDECYCDACETDRDPKDWIYYCTGCEFAAHLGCGVTGSYRPKQRTLENNSVYADPKHEQLLLEEGKMASIGRCLDDVEKEEGRRKERALGDGEGREVIKHFSHKHPLALYDEQWNGAYHCEACNINIFGKTYVCNDCEFYLHKQCLELPRVVRLRLHPDPLTLIPGHHFSCSYCGIKEFGFSFSCEECDFKLHTTCALLPANLNHESHEHPLNVAIFTPHRVGTGPVGKFPVRKDQAPPCNACRFPCEGLSLECEQCGFAVHLICALYPPTGKAETHMHGLVLNYSYQEDPDALEFFCDACEKPRTPNCWLYSCPEPKCYFVSHFECAVPNLIASLLSESVPKNKDIVVT